MVPSGWKTCQLGHCLAQPPDYGAAMPAQLYDPASTVRYIRITDITESGGLLQQAVGLAKNDAEQYLLSPGDIVVARSGASVGKSYLHEGSDVACAFAGYLIRFRADGRELLPEYLGQLLKGPQFWRWVGERMQVGAQPNISAAQYATLPILLPPLPEQTAVAAVLSRWDRIIEQLIQLIAAKRKLAKGLMQQLLSGKRRFSNDQAESWSKHSLHDVTQESTLRNNGYLQLESVMSVSKFSGMLRMKERVVASDIGRYKIVSPKSFAYNPMRVNIGSIAMWEGGEDALVSPDYVVFRCDESRLDPDFLNHYRHTHHWRQYVSAAGNGSVRVRIYYSDLARMKLWLPPLDEQRKIAEVLDAANKEIVLLEKKLNALKLQKKGLMQRLLTGQRRVKV